MATVITVKKEKCLYGKNETKNESLEIVNALLPYRLQDELYSLVGQFEKSGDRIEEIRLRSNVNVYVTVGGKGEKRNVLLSCVLTSDEVAGILEKMCDGSLYAYSESIIKGYVSLKNGIRVGVCGHASVEDGRIRGIYNVSSLNIRLPRKDITVDKKLAEMIRLEILRGEGTLIYSPPAQGKTTLLRSLAYELSGGRAPLRVALVDTREELGGFLDIERLSLDVLSGYPKAEGIRIATAFMNPQVIICDEIGSDEEALAIAQAQNCGVPLIASAHGSSAESLMKRKGIRLLHQVGAFGSYIGIRISSRMGFEYRVQLAKEVCFENIGNSDTAV